MSNDKDQLKTSKERPPNLSKRVWNLAEALTAFMADGMKTVTKDQYRHRLEICDTCDRRSGNRCLECGC